MTTIKEKGSRKSAKLKLLFIKITERCNMSCKFCGQKRIKDIDKNFLTKKSEELNLQRWKGLINGLKLKKITVYLWGGEPLLHNGTNQLIRTIKRKGYTCSLITNGYLLKKHSRNLVKSGLDFLEVSIDGGPKLHNKIRGLKGSFGKIEDGLRSIREIKKEIGSCKPLILMRSTLSNHNSSNITSIFYAAQRLKVNMLILQPLSYVPRKYLNKHNAILENNLGCETSLWRGFEAENNLRQPPGLKKAIALLSKKNWNFFVSLSPALRGRRADNYFRNYKDNFGISCESPWNTIGVSANGDVKFCEDFLLGNIKTDSLMKIWNGKKAQNVRKFILKNKGLEVCNRCCGLFREF